MKTAAEYRAMAEDPPAYEDVLYATDPNAHIQAVGRDAAGRLAAELPTFRLHL